MRSVFELAGSAATGGGVLSNLLSLLFVQGPRQRTQGSRKGLPATTCQRSARASCYAVRSQFWPRARDTLSARLECQPSRLHLGYQIHQTYCFFDIFRAAPTAVGRLLCALGSKL